MVALVPAPPASAAPGPTPSPQPPQPPKSALVRLLERLHAKIDPIALRILNWMNGIVGVLMAGITAFSAMHPSFPAEVQAALHLTPLQGMLFGLAWCSLVAYVVRRAAQAAS